MIDVISISWPIDLTLGLQIIKAPVINKCVMQAEQNNDPGIMTFFDELIYGAFNMSDKRRVNEMSLKHKSNIF